MRILFLGAPIQAVVRPDLPLDKRYEAVGYNTGNLLIGQSLLEELAPSAYAWGHNFRPEEANEKFDALVIGAANFIFRGFDFGGLADFVAATKLPCVMAGVGAQAPNIGDSLQNIPDGTKRLLKVVSDRSAAIGVRGAFTASVINDFGIKNVEIIGCPSLYRTGRRELTITPLPGAKTVDELKISLNGSRDVVGHSSSPGDARRVAGDLLALSFSGNRQYVLQSEMPEMAAIERAGLDDKEVRQLEEIARMFELPCDGQGLTDHIRTRFKVFYDLGAWDRYISAFDASVGGRFHGNLIALTNGVPAYIIVHDSRTREMAETMAIPHCGVEEIASPEDIFERLRSADYEAFERTYVRMYDRYAAFLAKNGLKHVLQNAA